MLSSMTGYGSGTVEENGRIFTIEMKSVNNRYLDINIRLPRQINALEDKVRKHISSKVSRGKIDVFINQEKFNEDDFKINVDEKIAKAYYDAYSILIEKFDLKSDISLPLLANSNDVISVQKKDDDLEAVWKLLLKALEEAINMFIDMRGNEGIKLGKDIMQRCDLIASLLAKIEVRAPEVVKDFREKISTRVADFLKDVGVDEARLLNEVAFYSDKTSITEEIVRLKSHIEQFKEAFSSKEPVGRKLDFLVQEMNRETNTIGSKANDLYITGIVIDIKSEIEKIREQIQNIE
jgi:uncharacterized protein (TIGR00255 family)